MLVTMQHSGKKEKEIRDASDRNMYRTGRRTRFWRIHENPTHPRANGECWQRSRSAKHQAKTSRANHRPAVSASRHLLPHGTQDHQPPVSAIA